MTQPERPPAWLRAVLLAVFTLAAYLANARYIGTWDTIPNELLPVTLLNERDLDFDEFAGITIPEEYYFVRHGGRVLSYYPIVPGLLNVPAHLVAKLAHRDGFALRHPLAKLTAAALVAASVAFLYLGLRRMPIDDPSASVGALVYALGTHAWSVASQGLWQHGPSLFSLTAAFWLLQSRARLALAAAGFALGCAVWNRPTNIVFALPLATVVAWQRRAALAGFLAGAAVPAVLMAAYSRHYWGTLRALGQGIGIAPPAGGHTLDFHHPLLPGLAALLFSPGRGLFIFSPVLLVGAAWAVRTAWRKTLAPLPAALGAGALLHLLLHAKWSVWWGGWSFGYRLLIEMLPALAIFTALAWRGWASQRVARRWLFTALAALSFYVQVLGAFAFPSSWNADVDIDRHPERCWDLRDTELARCHAKLFGHP